MRHVNALTCTRMYTNMINNPNVNTSQVHFLPYSRSQTLPVTAPWSINLFTPSSKHPKDKSRRKCKRREKNRILFTGTSQYHSNLKLKQDLILRSVIIPRLLCPVFTPWPSIYHDSYHYLVVLLPSLVKLPLFCLIKTQIILWRAISQQVQGLVKTGSHVMRCTEPRCTLPCLHFYIQYIRNYHPACKWYCLKCNEKCWMT